MLIYSDEPNDSTFQQSHQVDNPPLNWMPRLHSK